MPSSPGSVSRRLPGKVSLHQRLPGSSLRRLRPIGGRKTSSVSPSKDCVETSLIVVDTNILFGSLLQARSAWRDIILMDSSRTFFSPRYVVVELFKHKVRGKRMYEYKRLNPAWSAAWRSAAPWHRFHCGIRPLGR